MEAKEIAAVANAGSASGSEADAPGIRDRSCNVCHQRKIRCNRKQPCDACSRRGVPCVYPSSAKPPRRAKATTVADIVRRISGLETTLVTAAGGRIQADTPATPQGGFGEDVLVRHDSSSRYFDEAMLSKIIKLEHDVRSYLSISEAETATVAAPSPFVPIGIISEPFPLHLMSSLHPEKSAAIRLWTNYVNNIEPYVKILHVPTDEATVYSTIAEPHRAKAEHLALCFAIYFVSVAVPDRADRRGREERTVNLHRFRKGLEQALAHANFLERPTIVLLKALGIYLVGIMRLLPRSPGVFSSIGLHRDGQNLGLSPFETEIRRRLWWYFIVRDGKTAEDYGLQSTSSLNLIAEAEPPRNLDDGDIYRNMEELPPAREVWTPMIIQLIGIEFSRTWHRLTQIAPSTSLEVPKEELRLQIINDMRCRVGQLLRACSPVVPAQRLTMHTSSFVIRKIDFISRQQWAALQHPNPWLSESFTSNQDLLEAVEILEMGMSFGKDELLRPFRWLTLAYPQYHLTLYVLSHLCARPDGPHVERAWIVVEEMMRQVRRRQTEDGLLPTSNWNVLLALYSKAFNRYAISKSTLFFLFAVTIAASRAVHECGALKLVHDRGPSLNIIAIAQAFDATDAARIVRGKTTNNKPVDQLEQAMTNLDPTAWGKSAARAGAYARTALTAPVNGNTTK
ncbi:C6 transcription factor asaR [Colletotrichum sp. SAR11_240]|nr:C6 transcription factor asaR [Colletotrichum sp. SAR11_240]